MLAQLRVAMFANGFQPVILVWLFAAGQAYSEQTPQRPLNRLGGVNVSSSWALHPLTAKGNTAKEFESRTKAGSNIVTTFGNFARLGTSHSLSSAAPTIDRNLTLTNVTGQLGATVYLHCYVRNIGQKTVTWLRRADYHILTVGTVTYTTDERFSAVRGEGGHSHPFVALSADMATSRRFLPADDWMLQIRGLQKTDAGVYECQVNTQHPMLRAHVELTVLVPRASIAEGSEVSIMSGSELSITCLIHDCPQTPLHVFWYHGERVINYDGDHLRVNVTSLLEKPHPNRQQQQQRQRQTVLTVVGGGTVSDKTVGGDGRPVSRLTIHNASKIHSGSYTCVPIDTAPASLHVHVFHAEEQMSRQSSSQTPDTSTSHPLRTLYSLGPLLALQMAFLILVAVRTT